MMITESNYEEYFLLYTDNELNSEEREAVEAFILLYPQYSAELDMLLQTKLTGNESISFSNKSALYRSEANEITIHNYEEYFLLYTDNELTEEDKLNTERFVLQHPQLQPEFMLLQQTRLPLEHIAFANKESLYKKERQRRVLPLYIKRLSIAAAVIATIAFTWLLLPSGNNAVIVTQNQVGDKKQPAVKQESPLVLPQKLSKDTQQVMARQVQQKRQVGNTNISTLAKATDDIASTVKATEEKREKPDVVITLQGMQDVPVQPEQDVIAVQKESLALNNQPAATLKPLEDVSEEGLNAQTALLLSDNNTTVQPAVYKELYTEDDSQTLYVGSLQLNKAKVQGLLKSASRLLGGKTKQNIQ